MLHPRPHRLDRHGKIRHGEVVRRRGRAGLRRRRRRASALRGRGGAGDRSGVSRHHGRRQSRPRQLAKARAAAMPRRSSGWRRSCIRWCITRAKRFIAAGGAKRRGRGGARHSAAVRDRRRCALRRGGGGVGAGRDAADARLRAARHERGKSSTRSWPSRCPMRKSARGRISWWIPRRFRPGAGAGARHSQAVATMPQRRR